MFSLAKFPNRYVYACFPFLITNTQPYTYTRAEKLTYARRFYGSIGSNSRNFWYSCIRCPRILTHTLAERGSLRRRYSRRFSSFTLCDLLSRSGEKVVEKNANCCCLGMCMCVCVSYLSFRRIRAGGGEMVWLARRGESGGISVDCLVVIF